MSVAIIDKAGKNIGKVEPAKTFGEQLKPALLHQAVVRHLANRRAGTADTKRRDDVAGGGRKPWRQKGTGRARQGSIRSPQWRKGGIVFGPHPRSFAIGMNKTARRRALAMGMGAKIAAGELTILDASGLAPKKTAEFAAFLRAAKADRSKVLVVVHRGKDEGARAIELAGRNLARAAVIGHDELSVHALLAYERVLLTKHAYEALAEAYGG